MDKHTVYGDSECPDCGGPRKAPDYKCILCSLDKQTEEEVARTIEMQYEAGRAEEKKEALKLYARIVLRLEEREKELIDESKGTVGVGHVQAKGLREAIDIIKSELGGEE